MRSSQDIVGIVNAELRRFAASADNSLDPDVRFKLYESFGPSNFNDTALVLARQNRQLPALSIGDRARTHASLLIARKVAVNWRLACEETDSNFAEREPQADIRRQEDAYRVLRQTRHLEHVSVYDVPRSSVPFHILEMTEAVLNGTVRDSAAFRGEANEWWQIYGRPEQMEREFFIKWAAQDALYEAIGFGRAEPPAENAQFAFAGIFEGREFDERRMHLDPAKQREFWLAWLSEIISATIAREIA